MIKLSSRTSRAIIQTTQITCSNRLMQLHPKQSTNHHPVHSFSFDYCRGFASEAYPTRVTDPVTNRDSDQVHRKRSRNDVFIWDDTLPVSQASTLPASFYTDPTVLEREKLSIFSDEWLYVGRVDEVSEPGQFFTGELLGEPYVIVRDSNYSNNESHSVSPVEQVRGFFNVCCHHAMPVAKGRGQCDEFVCGYHGWSVIKFITCLSNIDNFFILNQHLCRLFDNV